MVCFPASEVRSYHTCITGTHKVNKAKQKTVAHITKSTFKQRLCGEGSRTIPDSKLNFYGTITELLKIQVHLLSTKHNVQGTSFMKSVYS